MAHRLVVAAGEEPLPKHIEMIRLEYHRLIAEQRRRRFDEFALAVRFQPSFSFRSLGIPRGALHHGDIRRWQIGQRIEPRRDPARIFFHDFAEEHHVRIGPIRMQHPRLRNFAHPIDKTPGLRVLVVSHHPLAEFQHLRIWVGCRNPGREREEGDDRGSKRRFHAPIISKCAPFAMFFAGSVMKRADLPFRFPDYVRKRCFTQPRNSSAAERVCTG